MKIGNWKNFVLRICSRLKLWILNELIEVDQNELITRRWRRKLTTILRRSRNPQPSNPNTSSTFRRYNHHQPWAKLNYFASSSHFLKRGEIYIMFHFISLFHREKKNFELDTRWRRLKYQVKISRRRVKVKVKVVKEGSWRKGKKWWCHDVTIVNLIRKGVSLYEVYQDPKFVCLFVCFTHTPARPFVKTCEGYLQRGSKPSVCEITCNDVNYLRFICF